MMYDHTMQLNRNKIIIACLIRAVKGRVKQRKTILNQNYTYNNPLSGMRQVMR
jgi:hypothetical protein